MTRVKTFVDGGDLFPGDLNSIEDYIDAQIAAFGAQVGDLKATAVTTAPAGWLVCDGAAVSRTTFADLFTAIGTAYGAGDGSTTFLVPDLRGRVPVGADATGVRLSANRTLGASGGEEKHLLTGAESGAAAHGHTGTANSHNIGQTTGWNLPVADTSWSAFSVGDLVGGAVAHVAATDTSITYSSGIHTHTLSINNNAAIGASSSHNNMQPFQVVTWIIKT